MSKYLIIGVGTVGGNLNAELKKLNCELYDKYKSIDTRTEGEKYDIAFVCVDTPLVNGEVETEEVVNAILQHRDNVNMFIIKSTVPVGFTSFLAERMNADIVFSPEYYGGTQHCNNFDFNFTILGGKKSSCIKAQNVLQEVYDARHTFFITDSTTAELTKFMENSWIAAKVTFCNEFYRIANKAGVDYETLREAFLLDPRVNRAHTFVYREHPYYKSHCLDKDVPSVANQFESEYLKFIISQNEKYKFEA